MKSRWSIKPKTPIQYELKKKQEEKYIGYLKRRYGLKRAKSFQHAS